MKKTIAMVLVANFFGAGNFAFASNPEPALTDPKLSKVEKSIAKMPQFFSGRVKETESGIILESADGSNYLLKGLSLNDIVGKNVAITGVVKNGKETNIIYVVEADVASKQQ